MNNAIVVNIVRFLGLLLLQILVLNEIELHGFIHPYIYPLFILLLPFETPRWAQLLSAFMLGLMVDIYANTIGFHAAASVWLAFIRTSIMQFNSPPGGYAPEQKPVLTIMGFNWSVIYIVAGVFLHHIVLFAIEAGSFTNILSTLGKIGASTIISSFLMMLYQFLFKPKM